MESAVVRPHRAAIYPHCYRVVIIKMKKLPTFDLLFAHERHVDVAHTLL